MGYSEAEVYAPFYRIRPTLRPPGKNVNLTKNPGKRTTTSTAGAPLTGGHARFDITAEEKFSASNSALIVSLELCRKRIPSEWKDRLSARTVEEFQVAMNMLEENPNEEPGEEQAIAAAPFSDEASGKERAIDAAPLPHDTQGGEKTLSDTGQPSARKHGARARKHGARKHTNDLFTFSSFLAACVEEEQPANEEHANDDEWYGTANDSSMALAFTCRHNEAEEPSSFDISSDLGALRAEPSPDLPCRCSRCQLSPTGRGSSSGNGATRDSSGSSGGNRAIGDISGSSGGNRAIGDISGSSGGNRAIGDSSGSNGGNEAIEGSSGGNRAIGDSSASMRSSPSHSGRCNNRSANGSGASKFSASYSSSAREISSTCGQDQLHQLYSNLSQQPGTLPRALNSGGDEARATKGRDETSPRAAQRAPGEARNKSNAQGSTTTILESGSRLAPGHTRENAAGGSETFRCGGSHPGMETTNNQEVRQAEKQSAHSPRFTSLSTSTSNQHRSPQSFMGSDSRLQHSDCGRIRDAPISHLDDDIDSDENLQPPIMSGPAPPARVEASPAAPPQATSSAAPEAQATSTASPAGQATPSTAIAAATAPRASTTRPEGQAHIDAAHDSIEPETTRFPIPCTQATENSEVYTVIDFDGRFDATRRRGSVLGSRRKDRNITTSTARKMFATERKSRRARARNIVTLIARRAVITQQQRRSEHRHLNGEKGGEYGFFKNPQGVARYRTTSTRRRTATRSNNDEEMFVRGGVSECDS